MTLTIICKDMKTFQEQLGKGNIPAAPAFGAYILQLIRVKLSNGIRVVAVR
jgi:hypothetical protein